MFDTFSFKVLCTALILITKYLVCAHLFGLQCNLTELLRYCVTRMLNNNFIHVPLGSSHLFPPARVSKRVMTLISAEAEQFLTDAITILDPTRCFEIFFCRLYKYKFNSDSSSQVICFCLNNYASLSCLLVILNKIF